MRESMWVEERVGIGVGNEGEYVGRRKRRNWGWE